MARRATQLADQQPAGLRLVERVLAMKSGNDRRRGETESAGKQQGERGEGAGKHRAARVSHGRKLGILTPGESENKAQAPAG